MTTLTKGTRVTVDRIVTADGTPLPGTITAVGTPIPGVGRWVTIRLDAYTDQYGAQWAAATITVTDNKVSQL